MPLIPLFLHSVVTATIGTAARDYSTITLWEAALDDNPPHGPGVDTTGECYDDSTFDESVSINGGDTIGLNSILLTVPIAERHDGTAGTGVRIVCTTGRTFIMVSPVTTIVEWIEFDGNGNGTADFAVRMNGTNNGGDQTIRNCLVHDYAGDLFLWGIECENDFFITCNVLDCVIYDIESTSTTKFAIGIRDVGATAGGGSGCNIMNCTVHNINHSNAGNAEDVDGIVLVDNSTRTMRNNIVTDTSTVGSGATADYAASSYSNATVSHNLASDASASGTGSLDSKTSANQYVGSGDFHLKSGADAIGAGTDLGTTPTGVEIDIDGRDRDSEADTWDMGADQFVAIGVADELFRQGVGYDSLT